MYNKELKISLLANDITMLLNDLNSVKSSLVVLKMFHQCSGLKINVKNTQTKYIGSLENDDYFPHGLSWIKIPIETLVITITDNSEQNYKYNFQNLFTNLKTTLNILKQRKLSLKGKIPVINIHLHLLH